jgi:hypothetical protein
MPFAKEVMIMKDRKKAKQEAAKIQKLEQKLNNKNGGEGIRKTIAKKCTTDYESDISDWLEIAKLVAEDDDCWSDLLDNDDDDDDDDDDIDGTNLNTIDENDDFIDMCDDSSSSSSSIKSSISSMESSFLLIDDNDDACEIASNVMKEPPEHYEKENHDLKNSTPPKSEKLMSSSRSNCDIVDLCSP